MDMNEILNFDPLAEAEKLTGKDYKGDRATMGLGFLMHLDHAERKQKALGEAGDTHMRTTFEQFYLIAVNAGFSEVSREHFYDVGEEWSTGREETYLLMWRDGVLLKMESYGENVNNAQVYFNLELEDTNYWPPASGHFHGESYDAGRRVYIGHTDVREGFIHQLTEFESHGRFLGTWLESPFLWLVTYADTRGEYDYKALNKKRIAQLPVEVQEAICAG